MIRRVNYILIICLCLPVVFTFAEEAGVILTIRQASDAFFDKALDGASPDLAGKEDSVMVVGLFNAVTFSVQSTNNIALFGADGTPIPLIIEKSSLYSEFEGAGINSMRIGFIISNELIDKGAPTLKWGDNVSASNSEVAKIEYFQDDKELYRTFSWEQMPRGGDSPYVATLEVIVDDYADTYYIWYIMPMILIFALLFVKKALLR